MTEGNQGSTNQLAGSSRPDWQCSVLGFSQSPCMETGSGLPQLAPVTHRYKTQFYRNREKRGSSNVLNVASFRSSRPDTTSVLVVNMAVLSHCYIVGEVRQRGLWLYNNQ